MARLRSISEGLINDYLNKIRYEIKLFVNFERFYSNFECF